MKAAILEKATEYVTDSAERASRAASEIAGVVDDGMSAAKRAARRSRDVAEDFVDSTARQIRRKPVLAALAALGVGVTVGLLIGRGSRR